MSMLCLLTGLISYRSRPFLHSSHRPVVQRAGGAGESASPFGRWVAGAANKAEALNPPRRKPTFELSRLLATQASRLLLPRIICGDPTAKTDITLASTYVPPQSLPSLFHSTTACGGCVRMEDQVDPAVKPERTTPGAAPVPAPGTATASRSSAPRVRLSCEACRQRKVKCDKLSPCTSCVRLGFQCVPVERARLPRGRTRKTPEHAHGSDKELAERVAKLEQLLKQVAAERDAGSHPEEPPRSTVTSTVTEHSFETKMADVETWRTQNPEPNTFVLSHRPRPSTTYMASSFWEDIMQQVSTLFDLDPVLHSEGFIFCIPRSKLIFQHRHKNFVPSWMTAWKLKRKRKRPGVNPASGPPLSAHQRPRTACLAHLSRTRDSLLRPRQDGNYVRSICTMSIQSSRSYIGLRCGRFFATTNLILTTNLTIMRPTR